ncbi:MULTISPECIES: type IV secretion system protein [Achromobacter]|uniref:Type IV secretion system protein n=1 Tax=Achromobacter spanius TaxID=217203 RepID=A0AA42S7J6_9BURK|nr:type IV secretion system protein [Achromobacter spanius]MDH0740364.1 type IV secretion system protein [Achromobacter spanius]
MATTAVSLASLGGIANWIDQSVTKMLTSVITPMVASVTAKLLPFVSVGLSVALVWYGWLICSGAIQTPVLHACRRVFNIAIIVSIAGTGGLYQKEIVGVMLELPTSVAKVFTGTVKTPSEMMDDAANNGAEIGTRLQERAPSGLKKIAQAFVFVVVSVIITIVSAVMSAIGMLVLITVKVGMGLVVVVGPFCILALLFDVTKEFFKSWLRQALYYSIYAGLFMVVFMFIMGMFGMLQQGLIDLTKADQINIFSMLTAIVFFMMCSKYMLEQVSTVAAKVTGGGGGGISVPFLGKIG